MSEPLVTTQALERLYHRVAAAAPPLRSGAGVVHHGPFSSPLRGHGLELADLRPYQWGDDPRHMDWRATARSGKPMTKVFMDERLRRVFLVVDRGPTMAFGTRRRLKAAMAVETGAVVAFTALTQRETVGGAVFDGEQARFFPPAAGLDGLLGLLHAAAAPLTPPAAAEHDAGAAAAQLLATLDAAVPPQSSLFLISDFAGMQRAQLPALLRLSQRRRVAAIHVADLAEQALPAAGLLRMTAPQGGRRYEIDTDDAALRRAYAAAATQRREALQALMHDAGIPLLAVRTDDDPLAALEGAPWTTTR